MKKRNVKQLAGMSSKKKKWIIVGAIVVVIVVGAVSAVSYTHLTLPTKRIV